MSALAGPHSAHWTLAIVAIQIAGLFCAWITRCSEGSALQPLCHRLFFGALLLMGGATVVALGIGPGCWISCGATLSIMVVGVTCEFSRSEMERPPAL
jgi:hypothetical protein